VNPKFPIYIRIYYLRLEIFWRHLLSSCSFLLVNLELTHRYHAIYVIEQKKYFSFRFISEMRDNVAIPSKKNFSLCSIYYNEALTMVTYSIYTLLSWIKMNFLNMYDRWYVRNSFILIVKLTIAMLQSVWYLIRLDTHSGGNLVGLETQPVWDSVTLAPIPIGNFVSWDLVRPDA
jgi:hypothetical protein